MINLLILISKVRPNQPYEFTKSPNIKVHTIPSNEKPVDEVIDHVIDGVEGVNNILDVTDVTANATTSASNDEKDSFWPTLAICICIGIKLLYTL